MRGKTASFGQHSPPASRIAWWVSFLATLALVFALGLARSAQALTLPADPGSLVTIVLPDPEEEPGEEDEGESEEGAEFEEECELSEDEEEELCEEVEGDQGTPPECLLSSTEATVSVSPAHDTVRLAVRYTARTSAAVKINFGLRGRKGSLSLGEDQKRFTRAGVFRQTERLSEVQMAKVVAAKSFTVELQAVNTPRYCHRYFDRSLTVRRASGGGLTWSAPAARSGA